MKTRIDKYILTRKSIHSFKVNGKADTTDYKIQKQIHLRNRKYSHTKFQNRCLLSSRGRGVLRILKVSRIKARELARESLIHSLTK